MTVPNVRISVVAHGASSMWAHCIIVWAWASWSLIGCCTSNWVGVAARLDNRASPCWWVPLWKTWAILFDRALTPYLGLCRLGLGHVARDIVRSILSLLIQVCKNVHFYRFLRHVVGVGDGGGGGGGGDGKFHIRGFMVPGVKGAVRLRWHPSLEPIPSPLGLFMLVRIWSNIFFVELGLKELWLLLPLPLPLQ